VVLELGSSGSGGSSSSDAAAVVRLSQPPCWPGETPVLPTLNVDLNPSQAAAPWWAQGAGPAACACYPSELWSPLVSQGSRRSLDKDRALLVQAAHGYTETLSAVRAAPQASFHACC
jgi:hypothetical protein